MNLFLPRDKDDGICTFGTIRVAEQLFQTLERPWIPGSPGGTPGRSCIPVGTYRLEKHNSEAHPRSFALVNEALHVYHYVIPTGQQGRTACLIHVANQVIELRGCIAPGMDRLDGEDAIGRSRLAINRFYAALPWEDNLHTLTIEDAV